MGLDVKVIGAAAVSFAAGLFVATTISNRKRRAAFAHVDVAIEALAKDWSALNDALQRLKSSQLHDQRPQLFAGSRARLATADEAMHSSLWDATNSDYCGEAGVIRAIDADGDVEFVMDCGTTVTVDIKFVKPLNEARSLAQLADDVEKVVKGLERGRERRANGKSTFTVTALS